MNGHWKENDKNDINMIEKGMEIVEKCMKMKGIVKDNDSKIKGTRKDVQRNTIVK